MRVGLALAAAVMCGCSASATLTLRDGREVRGRIVDSNSETVFVERDGLSESVRRSDISEVSHPGTWEVGIGGGLLLGGIVGFAVTNVAAEEDQRECVAQDQRAGYCNKSSLPWLFALTGIVGLVLEIDGVATYMGSNSRYGTPQPTAPEKWPPRACEPEQYRSCANSLCTQQCSPDGSGWGECVCPPVMGYGAARGGTAFDMHHFWCKTEPWLQDARNPGAPGCSER